MQTNEYTTQLIQAIRAVDFERVRQLLNLGVKPNVQDNISGETPLAAASDLGTEIIVLELIKAGANPNYKRTVEWPLATAAGNGHAAVVKLLLDHSALVDAQGEDGDTALMAAAAGGHLEVVKILLNAGADPKQKDLTGQTALTVATANNRQIVVDILAPFASGPDLRRLRRLKYEIPSSVSTEDMRQFFEAVQCNCREKVESFLERGVPVDSPQQDGSTALMWAANRGYLDLTTLLLAKGADPYLEDDWGEAALKYAADGAKLATFTLLYPLTSAKSQKRAMKQVRFLQRLSRQHPQWQGWEPPGIPTIPKSNRNDAT